MQDREPLRRRGWLPRQDLLPARPARGTVCDKLRRCEHVGSVIVRRIIELEQADLVLCGHIHEARAVNKVGRTRIANLGPVAAGHYAAVAVDGELSVRLDGDE